MSINKWMDKPIVAYNGLPFNNRKNELLVYTYIDDSQKYYAEQKKSDTKRVPAVWFHLNEILE